MGSIKERLDEDRKQLTAASGAAVASGEITPNADILYDDGGEPLVSIVIPTYNRDWGLKAALESALAQTYSHIEIIVMDDASSDETPQVVCSFDDPRIQYHRQAYNLGMVPNWGEGLARAQGEFVVFLSDDDLLLPKFVENRLRYLAEDPTVVVVFSNYHVQNREGAYLSTCTAPWRTAQWLSSLDMLQAALSRRWFVGAAMYRRSLVLEIWPQLVGDNLVLDLGLNIRLALSGTGHGIYTPSEDFLMMSHAGQNSQAKHEKVLQETEETLARLLQLEMSSPYAALLRREMASWNVIRGRLLMSQGRHVEGRARFRRALGWYPALVWAWKQLLLSWIAPHRITLSSQNRTAKNAG